MNLKTTGKLRILDFDCEARPLSWISQDYVSKEVTAIACKWIYEKGPVHCWMLNPLWSADDSIEMLESFRELYDQADIVTGHYIRGYDLKTINGAMIEHGLPLLGPTRTQDTKNDLARFEGMSKSQENLSATFNLGRQKAHLNQAVWRDANRLTPSGIAGARTRVVGDVLQHIQMRQFLADKGYLSPPVAWHPQGRASVYQP